MPLGTPKFHSSQASLRHINTDIISSALFSGHAPYHAIVDDIPSCSMCSCSRMNINPTTKTVTKATEREPPSLLYKNIALRDTQKYNVRRIASLRMSPIPSQTTENIC